MDGRVVAEVEDTAATAAGGGWRRLPLMPEKKFAAYHQRWPPGGEGVRGGHVASPVRSKRKARTERE